jgi:hypothetical protein
MQTFAEFLRRRPRVWACGLLVGVLTLAWVARAVSSGPASPEGVPVLASVDLGGGAASVLVTPGRPGRNLIRVPGPDYTVGPAEQALGPAVRHAGTDGAWAWVELASGEQHVWVGRTGRTARITVRTGAGARAPDELTGADGPECATAALGRMAAGRAVPLTTCPADGLAIPDQSALAVVVRFVASRGIHSISVVGDDSPRSRAAADAMASEARRRGVQVSADSVGPVVIVAGWDTAGRTLADIGAGRRLAPAGAYLAPWLLHPPLLVHPVGQLLSLPFGPLEAAPQGYLGALARVAPDLPPSTGGFQEYLEATGGHITGPVRLYAAARVAVPGDRPGHAVHRGTAWMPGGALTPVTPPQNAG